MTDLEASTYLKTPRHMEDGLIMKRLCVCPQEGAVVALFKICRQDRFRDLYAHALRTVASICCVEEGINQLDKVHISVSLSVTHKPFAGANMSFRLYFKAPYSHF